MKKSNYGGGMLVDHQIQLLCQNKGLIQPYDENSIQPSSYDLHLSNRFVTYSKTCDAAFLAPFSSGFNDVITEEHTVDDSDKFLLGAGEFCLAATEEIVDIPEWLAARFEGKSTLGRYGLMTHITAGFIDPGFSGQITVELHNVSGFPMLLTPGMPIGQICLIPLHGIPANPYGSDSVGSHYQHQTGPTIPIE